MTALALCLGGSAQDPAPAQGQAPSPAAARPPRPSDNPANFLKDPPKPASLKGKFSLVSVGDLMLGRPATQSTDPDFQKVLDMVRAGDAAIGNQEGVALDLSTLKSGNHGQGGLLYSPDMAKDYKAMGIDIVSVANNHSTDFGEEALLDSMQLDHDAGVATAGGGRNLNEARAGGFYDTPKGRVGLVSSASTFKTFAGATNGNGMMQGATGINALHTRTIHLVTADRFEEVRKLATELASPLKPPPSPGAKQIEFGEEFYRLSDHNGLHYEMDQYDHAGMLKAIRDAKAQSDVLVFHIHAHESPTGVDDDTPQPPDFLVTLFHDVVDAGADVVMGGGPHSLRGVEIYKGKPIFYGLAMFLFKPTLMGTPENQGHKYDETGYPPEPDPRPNNPIAWYDTVLAITDFDGAKVTQVRLYPIDLMNKDTPANRGLPHLAKGERAKQILDRLQTDSAQFGTKIAVQGDMGVIKLP
jgi:poly-gamma-glutamate synthesis protein (capsule biosynthesis protein)